MLVSVNLVNYNAERFIKGCLSSIFAQTYPEIEVLIIDNNPQSQTINIARNFIAEKEPTFPIEIIQNDKNLGFSAGHNLGIKESRGELILCLNQDVFLAPDFIAKAVEFFQNQKEEKIGAIQPKLLRLDKDLKKTDTIDTTGLAMLKNRRIIARGQGEKDSGQYEITEEIFGADGAAPVYLRKALEDVKLATGDWPIATSSGEYFDEDFFMYKEDVDLAWRLRLYGWKSFYAPGVRAWHARGSGESAATNYWAVIKERRKIGRFAKFLSFRNQRLLQIKNELPRLFFKHLPWFLPKELGAWGYALLFEKGTLGAISEIIRLTPRVWRKRKVIMSRKRVGADEMGKWFK